MMVKLKGKPADICTTQAYMPTIESSKAVDELYVYIQYLLDTETKGKDYTMVIGDLSATAGKGKDEDCVGHYGAEMKEYRNL